ncbi:hypothetical protein M434DRAFT_396628 [Hypoxylon sp. CO27-5]|nr:hypothetical protein M434DRAFT_396628 [Hypoxylon sp. CO27-5]
MSEESDIEDRVATELEDSLEEYDSEEYDSEEPNEFLDMEADESDGQFDDDDNSSSGDTELIFFPQFMRFPPELREHVWEFFDPHLKTKGRVFDLRLETSPITFGESASLAEQTAPARTMLATHRESRALALKCYPDTLDLYSGSGILRYHNARDVLNFDSRYTPDSALLEALMSLIGNSSHLAFSNLCHELIDSSTDEPPDAARKLRSIYITCDSFSCPKEKLQWCVSSSVHCFDKEWTEETIPGIPSVITERFCWPNLENHRAFAKKTVYPRAFYVAGDFEVWPMFFFNDRDGLDRYRKIEATVATKGEWSGWSSDTGSEDESVIEDEYESEGIDDGPIDEDEGWSSDADDLVVQSGSEDDDASSFGGFSPLQDGNQRFGLDDGFGVGNFSSLEPESPIHDGGESEHAASDEEPVIKACRRKRRIISSDDEHDSEDERNGTTNVPSRPAKRSRVVLSDTEDEDDGMGDAAAKHGHEAEDESHDDESSEEADEFEDEEPVKTKPMSLFEKLRQFREEVPVSPESGPGSDAGDSMDDEGFGGGSSINFPDDKFDEDEAMEDDRMVAGMSESGEEEEW